MELDGEITNEGWDFFDGSLKRRHVPSDGYGHCHVDERVDSRSCDPRSVVTGTLLARLSSRPAVNLLIV